MTTFLALAAMILIGAVGFNIGLNLRDDRVHDLVIELLMRVEDLEKSP